MTERKRDYSQGLIYKLCCNNLEVKEIYVGSTTNFKNRKHQHKSGCTNEKYKKYNFKVYKYIRDNGGWKNWDMVLVEEYNAKTKLDLESRERYWLETLKAVLNSHIPSRNGKEYYKDNRDAILEKCNKKNTCECGGKYTTVNKHIHVHTKKHTAYINKNNKVTEEKCADRENLTELVM